MPVDLCWWRGRHAKFLGGTFPVGVSMQDPLRSYTPMVEKLTGQEPSLPKHQE